MMPPQPSQANMTDYVAVIHKDRGSDYGVSFPDVPGCVAAGATIEEAVQDARAALSAHLALLAEGGEPVPPPRTMEEATSDPEYADAKYFTFVPAKAPERVKVRRVNITLPEDLLSEIDSAGASMGLKRSQFLAEAARRLVARAPTARRTITRASAARKTARKSAVKRRRG